jgi:hypothetical protein
METRQKLLKTICEWRDPKNDSQIPTNREKKCRQTFDKMEGFSFVSPVTGLNRPNTGKEDDDEYDSVNTRKKHQLRRPIANISCFQKSAFCTGNNIFNSLPSSLTNLVNKKSQFKVALKRYLNTHCFYCVDEFLMFENDSWCIFKSFHVA